MKTIRRQTKECADKLLPHARKGGTAELFGFTHTELLDKVKLLPDYLAPR